MKIFKKIICVSFLLILILGVNNAKALDFTSNQIKVKNDIVATQKNLYPVLIVENTTDKDLVVDYNFYLYNDYSSSTSKQFSIKAYDTIVLELPELHHLGDSGEQRNILFSWNYAKTMKPLQTQISTAIFKNHEDSGDKTPSVEFGNSIE